MEIQRFVLSCLFQVTVIAMLFRRVTLSVVKAVQSMARKIRVKVQKEFDVFREHHADKNSLVWNEGHLFEGFNKDED